MMQEPNEYMNVKRDKEVTEAQGGMRRQHRCGRVANKGCRGKGTVRHGVLCVLGCYLGHVDRITVDQQSVGAEIVEAIS